MLDPATTGVTIDLALGDVMIELSAVTHRDSPDVSAALKHLQAALQVSYAIFAHAASPMLETVAVVDEVSKRSAALWMRVAISPSEVALTDGLLKYIGRGILTLVGWMDNKEPLCIADLQTAIRVLAWGTSATSDAHPAVPTSAKLVEAITAWQLAMGRLQRGETAQVVMSHGSVFLPCKRAIPDAAFLLVDRTTITRAAEMIYIVEKPDYQSTGQWLLRFGELKVKAAVDRGTSLDRFYTRQLDVRPGDALHCRAEFQTDYGPDHEVIGERIRLVEVMEVLRAGDARPEASGADPAVSWKAPGVSERELA